MTANMKTLSQLITGTRPQQQHQQAQVAGPRRHRKVTAAQQVIQQL